MKSNHQIKVVTTKREDGYRIFTLKVSNKKKKGQYRIYVFDKDLPLKKPNQTPNKLDNFAIEQMKIWLDNSGGKLPKDRYRVLVSGGKITTDDIDSFLSVQKKMSDLVRTNVTIAASLFEWAKAKAQKEGTSFSDLVSRGLITLKDSDKEIGAWFKEQGAYFRKKLGNFGSFEVFHYLPNNYNEIDQSSLKDALQSSQLRRTGWPIGVYLNNSKQRPHPQPDGIRAEFASSDYLLLDYWYAKNKGEFYFARNLPSDGGNGRAKPKTCLYFDTLIWRMAEALEHCIAYYQALSISGDERVKISISLYGLNGRTLSAWNQMRAFTLSHYSCGSDKSSWEIETSLTELTNNLDDVIYESVKKLFVMFSFFVPAKGVVNDILNNEYRKSQM